jgi:hypothetical protein
MRLAGSSEIFSALAGRFTERAQQTTPPTAVDATLDAFFQAYALLKSKGYSDSAAEQVATGMIQGVEPMQQPTKRFAALYGDAS